MSRAETLSLMISSVRKWPCHHHPRVFRSANKFLSASLGLRLRKSARNVCRWIPTSPLEQGCQLSTTSSCDTTLNGSDSRTRSFERFPVVCPGDTPADGTRSNSFTLKLLNGGARNAACGAPQKKGDGTYTGHGVTLNLPKLWRTLTPTLL